MHRVEVALMYVDGKTQFGFVSILPGSGGRSQHSRDVESQALDSTCNAEQRRTRLRTHLSLSQHSIVQHTV